MECWNIGGGGNLNWVTVIKSIQIQSPGVVCSYKLCPDVILRETVIHTEVLDPWRKALIKPQMGPPFLQNNPLSVNGNQAHIQANVVTWCLVQWTHTKNKYIYQQIVYLG